MGKQILRYVIFGSLHFSFFPSIPFTMIDQLRSGIIEENLIGKGLDTFHVSFHSIYEGANVFPIQDAFERFGSNGKAI